MKKTKKSKILPIILAMLLTVIAVAACVLFRYYPHYRKHKAPVTVDAAQSDEIKIMSYNVRCLTPLDLGKKSWYYRADLIMSDIASEAPDIIGFQEATKWQYNYLVDCMPQYDSVITYRDKSVASEGCPIFYNTEQFTLIDKGSFWLSETPDVMSKDWGSACYRICSYVILTENVSGKDFVVFNTHLDHVSDEARINGIKVVLDKIQQFGGLPAVIMGDLNAEVGSETYASVTEHFLDAQLVAANAEENVTYQGWGEAEGKRIDYFMVSMTGLQINSYDVLTETHDGVYSSDHNPIVMTAVLE